MCFGALVWRVESFSTMIFDPVTANFHKVLEQAGKTVLRPGGSAATEQLLNWAQLDKSAKVIELAAGLGYSSRKIANQFGCHVLLTDQDQSRLEKAQEEVQKHGLGDYIQCRQVNMFSLDETLAEQVFDCAITEASLTHYVTAKKVDFFRSVAPHTKHFLLHEVYLRCEDSEQQKQTRQNISKTLHIGFCPETLEGWRNLLTEAGFEVEHESTGPLAVLDPSQIFKDEGLWRAVKIVWNLLTHKTLRERVLSARAVMLQHGDDLGFVIMSATRQCEDR